MQEYLLTVQTLKAQGHWKDDLSVANVNGMFAVATKLVTVGNTTPKGKKRSRPCEMKWTTVAKLLRKQQQAQTGPGTDEVETAESVAED